MNTLDAKRHALIVEKAKELKILLEYEPDIETIDSLIDGYQATINDFNAENYEICDPESSDIQQYKINRKKWIHSEYGDKIEITSLINKMSIDFESFKMYTLLRRKKNSRSFYATETKVFWKLYDTLKETIKNTILKEFAETNKEVLSKILIAR